jgi:hypothetical protein
MTQIKKWKVGEKFWIAQVFRNGRGLDYDCQPFDTKEEAEADLRDSLCMMVGADREQAKEESFVSLFEVTAIDDRGGIASSKSGWEEVE